jgi:hypothetical protein
VIQDLPVPVYVFERLPAGKGLDSADSGCDAGFLDDQENPEFTRRVCVRTAAKLATEPRNFNQPDPVTVFFFKKRHSSRFQGFLQSHYPNAELLVSTDFIIYQPLDLNLFFRGHCGEMGEIEPETVRRDERSGLLCVISEHIAQGRVQDMCGCVVDFCVLAHLGVNCQMNRIAGVEKSGFDLAQMNDQVSG